MNKTSGQKFFERTAWDNLEDCTKALWEEAASERYRIADDRSIEAHNGLVRYFKDTSTLLWRGSSTDFVEQISEVGPPHLVGKALSMLVRGGYGRCNLSNGVSVYTFIAEDYLEAM